MRFMLVLLLVLAGCATAPSPQAVAVRDADQKMVEGCEFVGSVSGHSMLGPIFGSAAEDSAKAEATNAAAERGATHLVMQDYGMGAMGGYARGQAYRCAA